MALLPDAHVPRGDGRGQVDGLHGELGRGGLVAAVSSTSAVPNSTFASEKSSLEDTSTLMRLNVFSAFSYPLRYRLMECISLGSPKSYCRYTSSQLAYPLFSALPFSSPAMILVMLLSVGPNPVSPSVAAAAF